MILSLLDQNDVPTLASRRIGPALAFERLLGDPERPRGWQAGALAALAALTRATVKLEPIPERVRHGDQSHVGLGVEGIVGRPRAAASTADQAELEDVAARRMGAASK